jgi:hypothetical protein
MSIEGRLQRLEQLSAAKEKAQEQPKPGPFLLERICEEHGLKLEDLEAEQEERASRGDQVCLMQIVCEHVGISFEALKAALKEVRRVHGG